jgi:hypothetical protein
MIKSESVFPRHIMVRRRRDRMVVGFTTTCAISTYTERMISSLVYLHY